MKRKLAEKLHADLECNYKWNDEKCVEVIKEALTAYGNERIEEAAELAEHHKTEMFLTRRNIENIEFIKKVRIKKANEIARAIRNLKGR